MPIKALCVQCGTVGLVRREFIVTATTSVIRHHCGYCQHTRTIEETEEQTSQSDPAYAAVSNQTNHS